MKTPPKPLTKKNKLTLNRLVRECHRLGIDVSVSLEPNEMPMRFASDPEPVKLLIAESERCTALGNRWMKSKVPNPVAADACFRNGWAYSLAAAWMRAKLKGELLPEKKDE